MHRLLALAALALALAVPSAAQDTFVIENVRTFSGGMMGGSGPFTLVSLRDGSVVVEPDAAARADSASAAWDVGLRGNEVVINGGASGPGGLRAALLDADFDALDALPEGATLLADGERDCPRGAATVVCHGSGNGWYSYEANGVQPIPGKVLVIERPDGSAVKVRFLRYTLGADLGGPRPRFVTLEAAPLAPAE